MTVTFTLLNAGNATYTFNFVFVTGLYPGATWERVGSGNIYTLEITAIPDPSATGLAAAILLGGIILFSRRRG